jgi:hypothetical protein
MTVSQSERLKKVDTNWPDTSQQTGGPDGGPGGGEMGPTPLGGRLYRISTGDTSPLTLTCAGHRQSAFMKLDMPLMSTEWVRHPLIWGSRSAGSTINADAGVAIAPTGEMNSQE